MADARIVRVAAVQFAARAWPTEATFLDAVARDVRIAAEMGAQAVVFPELFTLPVGAIGGVPDAATLIDRLTAFTATFEAHLISLATQHAVTVIGGSHLSRDASGAVRNRAPVAVPGARCVWTTKLHPTPDERSGWRVAGGSALAAIETPFGRAGVLICYDSEFPELGRHLTDQGIEILFVPYLTDTRHGQLRVRHSCHARAIENQIHVVTAGGVGTLEGVPGQDIQYARSAILTPIDVPFARDGIAAEASAGVHEIIVADLDLGALQRAREEGAVRNLADRRLDLYETLWKGA